MFDMQVQVRACSSPWHGGVQFLIKSGQDVGTNIVMTRPDPGTVREPTFTVSMDAAQTLMDDLWNAGLRPTEGTGSAGALAATERHLADMRKLVFDGK